MKKVIVNNYIVGTIKMRFPETEINKIANNKHEVIIKDTDYNLLSYLKSFIPIKKQLEK